MRHIWFAALLSIAPSFAQTPGPEATAAAGTRLQKALATMANLPSCSFESAWGPDASSKKKADEVGFVVMGGAGPTEPGSVAGTYTQGILHVTCGDSPVAFANRRMITKGADGWVVRRGKLADGSQLPFVPDPQLFFELLQNWPLAITHREVGTLADKPVEILSVTLNDDQVAEALWSGLLPEAAGGLLGGITVLRARAGVAIAAGGAGGKAGTPKPEATVDLAFYLDPATGQIHEVRSRAWTKAGALPGGLVAFRAGGGAVRVGGGGGGGDDDAEDEPEAEPAAAGKPKELQYKDGLPVRPRKDMMVTDYTLKFREHGTAKAPELDANARALLGLR